MRATKFLLIKKEHNVSPDYSVNVLQKSICNSDSYMIHLYCLAVQAGFYSDVVECSPVT